MGAAAADDDDDDDMKVNKVTGVSEGGDMARAGYAFLLVRVFPSTCTEWGKYLQSTLYS